MSKKGSVPSGRVEFAVQPRVGIYQDKAPMPFVSPVSVAPQTTQPQAAQPQTTQPASPPVAPTKSSFSR